MEILLIEDDPSMSAVLRTVLESRGHTVTAAADGESGWERYQGMDFPLVILDWLLPGIDGLEVCRRIRRGPKGAECLILVITVRTNPGDLEQVLAAGADDYLAKPIDTNLLDIRLAIAEQRVAMLRKQAESERALRESEERFKLITETIDEVFWITDVEINNMIYISPGYERIWQRSCTSLQENPRAFLDAILPEDKKRLLTSHESRKKGLSFEHEFRIRRPDGSVRWIMSRGYPVTDASGKVTRYVGISQDISRSKQQQDDLTIAKAQSELAVKDLEHTLSQLSAVFDATADGILVVDSNRRIIAFNQSFVEMWGIPKSILESHDDQACLEYALTQCAFPDVFAQKVEMLYALPESESFDVVELLDGRVFERTSKPQRIVNQVIGRVWTFCDVTQEKRALSQMKAAKEAAEEANLAKSQFIGRMSHELRTPLNAILGFAQIMEAADDNEPISAHRDHLNTVIRSGWHLLRIIRDLLNLSAIEANKVVLHIENVDVRPCMDECFKLMLPLASERGIELSCNNDACDGLLVRADAFRLKQVLINLLANAIKYNRDGGCVTVSGQQTPGHLRILVSDTGLGIPEGDLSSLFEPFSRLVQRPYSIEGAGIGLSIAKQLIELMGGTIGVESVHGKGSTFWIELPASEAPEEDTASLVNIPRSLDVKNATTGKQATLLYIEDNPDHVELLKEIVSRTSRLSLLAAHTPSIGLDLARAHRPDLVLLDICLPGMDGYQVLERLQADARTCNIPVMAISASATPAEIEKGLQAGFRRYLTKPLNVLEFKDTIEELLRDTVSQNG